MEEKLTTFRMPAEIRREIEMLASKEGMDKSKIMRELLKAGIREKKIDVEIKKTDAASEATEKARSFLKNLCDRLGIIGDNTSHVLSRANRLEKPDNSDYLPVLDAITRSLGGKNDHGGLLNYEVLRTHIDEINSLFFDKYQIQFSLPKLGEDFDAGRHAAVRSTRNKQYADYSIVRILAPGLLDRYGYTIKPPDVEVNQL